MNNIELLAPAGNLEKLKMAVLYGADAVYFGGQNFGLRAGAKNFDLEDIEEGVKFCHDNGAKAYVTVNMIPHEDDLKDLEKYIEFLEEIKVDAVIVADPGIMSIVKNTAPDMEIHLSTQANTTNSQSANFWYSQGVKRIVLARELSLKEIEQIHLNKNVDLDLEAFVHGAMCISYSGRCLLSSYMAGRHANLGDCAQPCRWKYALVEQTRPGEYYPIMEDDQGSFILNSKDLCMFNNLRDIIGVGVKSLKIEGRMKSSYYTATVVRSYRKAIDNLKNNNFDKEYWFNEILKASHRDFTTGFYYGNPKDSGQLYTSSSYIREYDFIGWIKDYDPVSKIATVEQRNKFSVGEEVEIFGPHIEHMDFKIESIVDDKGEEVESAPHPQQIVKLKMDLDVKKDYLIRRKR
ncbi:MAG TPA: peptidase U32 [Clostridiales bacterium]|nr:peptidase U32 [Clostridiales bacterium]